LHVEVPEIYANIVLHISFANETGRVLAFGTSTYEWRHGSEALEGSPAG
jgi:hypothetical protein